MDVELTPGQKAFAQSEAEAVREALGLWEERERQRAELLLTLEDARASLARGEGLPLTEDSIQRLASEVKERGRPRLMAELNKPR
jgi:Arc/MetJ-type ribon-helix-helix transcriptional regulator